MAYVSVTNTFVNGAVGDATQVNTNFTDLVNGLSDGTKNLLVKTGSFASGVETPYLTATSAVVGGVLTAAQVSSPSGVFANLTPAYVSCVSGVFTTATATKVSAATGVFATITLVNSPNIYSVYYGNYDATIITGWSTPNPDHIAYGRIGSLVNVFFSITGTSNSDTTRFTLPYKTIANTSYNVFFTFVGVDNGGAEGICTGFLDYNSTLALLYAPGAYGTAWTASGTKTVKGNFSYYTVDAV